MKSKLLLAVIISLIIILVFCVRAYNDQKLHIEELTSSRIDYHYHIVRINEGLLRECIQSSDSSLISSRLEYVDFNYRSILDNLADTSSLYRLTLDQLYSKVHSIVYERDLTNTNTDLLELYEETDALVTKFRDEIYLSKSKGRTSTEEWIEFINSNF